MLPYLLSAVALLLIFLEFYLPGAIMATIGTILLIISISLFATDHGSGFEFLLFLIGNCIAVYAVIRFAIWKIKTSSTKFGIYSDSSQVGFIASKYDQSAVGKKGTVKTDLKPGGYVIIDGTVHQALSETGYLPKGTEIFVIGGQEESLIVKQFNKDTQ
jgi:membrane-bound serine protease (ClpP class)